MKECDLDVYKQAIIVGKFVDIKKRAGINKHFFKLHFLCAMVLFNGTYGPKYVSVCLDFRRSDLSL